MSASVFRPCLRKTWFQIKCRPRAVVPTTNALTKFLLSRQQSTETATPFTPPSSSVSQDEVSHFTQLAATWWDPYGPSRLLHLMNPLRHDFIRTCLQSRATSSSDEKYTYLDIGCGGGIFATSAARLPSTESVTAIDPTLPVIQVAKSKQRTDPALQEPRLTYLNCAVEDLQSHIDARKESSESANNQAEEKRVATPRQQYDIITMFEVIEHISQPSDFLSQALQHLKPGGWLIGSTISRHPISYITTKLVAEAPLIGVVPRGTHNWNQYINPGELTGWFLNQNTRAHNEGRGQDVWGNIKIQGVVYVPVLGWRLVTGSERYGNYFFGVQKL